MLYRDPNNDSAARGLRQAEKGVQFLLREELQEWLEQLGLFDYAMLLFEQGFDDLSVLQSLRPKVRRAASAAAIPGFSLPLISCTHCDARAGAEQAVQKHRYDFSAQQKAVCCSSGRAARCGGRGSRGGCRGAPWLAAPSSSSSSSGRPGGPN